MNSTRQGSLIEPYLRNSGVASYEQAHHFPQVSCQGWKDVDKQPSQIAYSPQVVNTLHKIELGRMHAPSECEANFLDRNSYRQSESMDQ